MRTRKTPNTDTFNAVNNYMKKNKLTLLLRLSTDIMIPIIQLCKKVNLEKKKKKKSEQEKPTKKQNQQ